MAGLEERLKRLEGIVHNLFCCDNNQFTGPQGPQGPMGNPGEPGEAGPPGADGAIIFENLNWLGEFVPCVVYNQFDAVSYNGSSYFLNCENSTGFECETPVEDETCWVLLANAGATGPQGPRGLKGIEGNDGSNSGRWIFNGSGPTSVDPGSTYFVSNNVELNDITSLVISYNNETTVDYESWFKFLRETALVYRPLVLFQITEVGSNNVIGVYKVTSQEDGSLNLNNFSSYMKVDLEILIEQTAQLTKGKTYTISWSIHSLGQMAPKTVGNVTAAELGVGAELVYDFNIVNSGNKTACVYLPNTTQVGKEIVVFSTRLENTGFYVQSNSEITIHPIDLELVSTGYLTTFGIDEGLSHRFVYPNGNYKFTFLGNIAAGGKAFWNMEALPNTYFTLIPGNNILNSSTELYKQYYTASFTALTTSDLNTLFPNLSAGEQVFAPNQPGGPKIFIKTAFSWYSTVLTIVT